jgi:predicted glycogen debranching enzyme
MTAPSPYSASAEWLEADGLGGFACGTVDLVRTRRYHAALTVSLRPPSDRIVLVSGFDVWLETPAGQFALASHRYLPDVVHPVGGRHLAEFSPDPWPRWTYRLDDGTEIIHELTVPRDQPVTLLTWRLGGPPEQWPEHARLLVRPLLACRDAHLLHQVNPSFNFDADQDGEMVRWHPYLGIPGVVALSDGEYSHDPVWYHGFLYTAERDQGLDCTEDLASPGGFRWDLAAGEATLILSTDSSDLPPVTEARALLTSLRETERERRARLGSPLLVAAESFLVRRGNGRTILAGYPWALEWGRDTFVALRGLCIASDCLEEARQILLEWCEHVSGGMLPSVFPDRAVRPEFHAVDASLWFVVAVHDYMQAVGAARHVLPPAERNTLRDAVSAILSGYLSGTRFGIHVTDDGLLAAGEIGSPLTWMDSRIGDWAVTPRVGKPVEVQALWLNALRIGTHFSSRWTPMLERGLGSFLERFWYGNGGYLYDVVDVDHREGAVDSTLRPNQIFAVGGLPFPLLGGFFARRVVSVVESSLLTPLGLRTLAPADPQYVGQCEGNLRQRHAKLHQGTAWPWLLGPFVEAWVRIRGNTPQARRQASAKFLTPILQHLGEAGIGHVSEVADGDFPHTPRGAPFQAWSLGEVLRLQFQVLAEDSLIEMPSPLGAAHIEDADAPCNNDQPIAGTR